MKYISLFSGIGGFDLALNKLGHKCVYANDFDKYAAQIYRKNIGEIDTKDIRTVNASDIADAELLVGGFPCQAFSIAGKRKGFDDTRGTLFFEIARILEVKKTRFFLLENVKGLLSHESGNTFKTIISTLTKLGYNLQWQVLNSKDFGVPQNRERVFIIGHLRGEPRPQVFPFKTICAVSSKTGKSEEGRTQTEYSTPLRSNPAKKADDTFIKETQKLPDALRIRNTGGSSVTLKGLGGGLGAKTGLYNTTSGIRRLTPLECERLQGFPDGWTEGLSDTQRYKCLGNAVTVNVVYEIAKRMFLGGDYNA